MTDMDPEEIAIAAVGDQVQTVLQNSTYQINVALLISADGGVEVRSQLSYEDTKRALEIVAEEF